ncbi:hypothetical protein LEQ41_09255 [Streptococcus agalactiae]|nr:hypothetical protein [Streptococcus agalactiae]
MVSPSSVPMLSARPLTPPRFPLPASIEQIKFVSKTYIENNYIFIRIAP